MTRVAICFAAFLLTAASVAEEAVSSRVTEVIDGDTVRVQREGAIHIVRIIGIDAPELHHPNESPQYLANESSAALAQLVLGHAVKLVADGRVGADRFGRDLSYLELENGTDLGAQLISRGLARVFTKFPFARKQHYQDLESAARAAGLGVWANGGLAEFQWLANTTRSRIEVLPLSGARFAVRWNEWVRLGVSSRQLADAIWAARRAAGMRDRDPVAADRELSASGFRSVSAADPTVTPRPPAKVRVPRRDFHPKSPDRFESD